MDGGRNLIYGEERGRPGQAGMAQKDVPTCTAVSVPVCVQGRVHACVGVCVDTWV